MSPPPARRVWRTLASRPRPCPRSRKNGWSATASTAASQGGSKPDRLDRQRNATGRAALACLVPSRLHNEFAFRPLPSGGGLVFARRSGPDPQTDRLYLTVNPEDSPV